MNNKGYLLAEMCIALAVAAVAAVIMYNGLSGFARSWQNVQSDLMLYRAARYSQSFIEHELLLNSSRLKITTGSNDKIVAAAARWHAKLNIIPRAALTRFRLRR